MMSRGECFTFGVLLSSRARYGGRISFQKVEAYSSASAASEAAWLSAAKLDRAILGSFHDLQIKLLSRIFMPVGDVVGFPGLASASYDQGRFAAAHITDPTVIRL